MARTNSDLVKAELLRDYNTVTSPDLSGVIAQAFSLTNRVVAQAADLEVAFLAEDATMLETVLAAWAYCCGPDKPYASRSNSGASGSFQGTAGKLFEANLYGHKAMLLDPTGYLRALNDGQSVSCFWVGKTKPNQLDYNARN